MANHHEKSVQPKRRTRCSDRDRLEFTNNGAETASRHTPLAAATLLQFIPRIMMREPYAR
jgi:hypothetical protein